MNRVDTIKTLKNWIKPNREYEIHIDKKEKVIVIRW